MTPRAGLRLLAVHAHPDDESSKGAASTVRYVREGVSVMVVTCTGGERGDILNPKLAHDPEVLANIDAVRRKEMADAARILGVEHAWLGFVDSGWVEDYRPETGRDQLPDGCFARVATAEAAVPLATWIRRFRPHVVTTYDEKGGYPHPDHVMTHDVTMVALELAADQTFNDGFDPWDVSKVYYHLSFHRARLEALNAATLAAGLESPFQEWLDDWEDRPEDTGRLTTSVECAEFFSFRDAALLAHATQIDEDGWWFHIPLEVQQRAWSTEDFQLAWATVPTSLPEDDLFAGLLDGRGANSAASSAGSR